MLVQSQSSWPWWALIRSVPLYQWVNAPLAVLISFFMFSFLLLLIWTLGGSVRCSNVGLRLYRHPSSDEGSLCSCLLCSRSLSFCFSFGPRELSPVFRCGSLSLSPSIARWRFWDSCLFPISRQIATWFSSGSPSYLASLGSRIIGSKTFNYG